MLTVLFQTKFPDLKGVLTEADKLHIQKVERTNLAKCTNDRK